jgi:STAS-like domain of unknown function (DUF4325)
MAREFRFLESVNWAAYVNWLSFFKTSAFFERKFILNFRESKRFFPSGILPIVSHLAKSRDEGFEFTVLYPGQPSLNRLFINNGWNEHLIGNIGYRANISSSNSCIRNFNTRQDIGDSLKETLEIAMRNCVIQPGVLEGFEWCVNEILDNVLVHAESKFGGFFQCIHYHKSHRLAVTICDSGIGVLESLREGYPNTRSNQEAVNLAVKKGITRNKDIGQGNGLAGKINIVNSNAGYFLLHTGNAAYKIGNGEVTIQDTHKGNHKGTLIDIEFDTNHPIVVSEALWGMKPFNYVQANYSDEDYDIVFKLSEHETNFGNRETGKYLRNKLHNLYNATDSIVKIDFSNIRVISSSFSDEFIAKFILSIGIDNFKKRIVIFGLSDTRLR